APAGAGGARGRARRSRAAAGGARARPGRRGTRPRPSRRRLVPRRPLRGGGRRAARGRRHPATAARAARSHPPRDGSRGRSRRRLARERDRRRSRGHGVMDVAREAPAAGRRPIGRALAGAIGRWLPLTAAPTAVYLAALLLVPIGTLF